jgi:hypothetical protein
MAGDIQESLLVAIVCLPVDRERGKSFELSGDDTIPPLEQIQSSDVAPRTWCADFAKMCNAGVPTSKEIRTLTGLMPANSRCSTGVYKTTSASGDASYYVATKFVCPLEEFKKVNRPSDVVALLLCRVVCDSALHLAVRTRLLCRLSCNREMEEALDQRYYRPDDLGAIIYGNRELFEDAEKGPQPRTCGVYPYILGEAVYIRTIAAGDNLDGPQMVRLDYDNTFPPPPDLARYEKAAPLCQWNFK